MMAIQGLAFRIMGEGVRAETDERSPCSNSCRRGDLARIGGATRTEGTELMRRMFCC